MSVLFLRKKAVPSSHSNRIYGPDFSFDFDAQRLGFVLSAWAVRRETFLQPFYVREEFNL